jgi:hypothetical protein
VSRSSPPAPAPPRAAAAVEAAGPGGCLTLTGHRHHAKLDSYRASRSRRRRQISRLLRSPTPRAPCRWPALVHHRRRRMRCGSHPCRNLLLRPSLRCPVTRPPSRFPTSLGRRPLMCQQSPLSRFPTRRLPCRPPSQTRRRPWPTPSQRTAPPKPPPTGGALRRRPRRGDRIGAAGWGACGGWRSRSRSPPWSQVSSLVSRATPPPESSSRRRDASEAWRWWARGMALLQVGRSPAQAGHRHRHRHRPTRCCGLDASCYLAASPATTSWSTVSPGTRRLGSGGAYSCAAPSDMWSWHVDSWHAPAERAS